MELLTADAIVSAPLNIKERDHQSRSRRGIHVYLSRYLADFKMLEFDHKQRILNGIPGYEYYGHALVDEDSVDSIDSVDTMIEDITHRHAMKIAFYNWSLDESSFEDCMGGAGRYSK